MLEFFAAECAQVAVPEKASEQAMRYYNSGTSSALSIRHGADRSFTFSTMGILTGKMSVFAQRLGRKWYFVIVIYLILYLAISQLLSFPLDFYAGYLRHEYGLSTEGLGHWFGNYGKSFLVGIISAAAFVWIFYLVRTKVPTDGGSMELMSIGIVLVTSTTTYLDLSTRWTKSTMKDKQLEEQILALASKAGIQGGRVYEVDKSQETKTMNAYVIGFGTTKRIALWDTTLAALTPDQILFVNGVLNGYYVLNHMWWNMAYYTAPSNSSHIRRG